MFSVTGLCLLIFLGMPALALAGLSLPVSRARYFPLAVILSLGIFLVGALILYPFARFDWRLLATLTLSTVVMTRLLACRFFPDLASDSLVSPKVWCGILLLAGLLNADVAVIFPRQGWGTDERETYFRPPMHNDVERHVIVNNALLRHSGSPMLAGSEFLYQLAWHHLSAVFTGVFPEPATRYYQVGGVILATAILFTWGLLVALYGAFRKSFSPLGFLGFSALLFFHTDIFHFLVAFYQRGVPAIEADWSFGESLFLRCFSLKLIGLTAPQHALFFLFLTGFFMAVGSRMLRELFFLFAFLVSPLMVGFFFIPYGIFRALIRWEWRWIPYCTLVVAYFAYRVLYGFWPHELGMRPGTSSLSFFLSDPKQWLLLPLAPVVAAGLPGAIAIYLAIRSRQTWRELGDLLGPMIIGTILFGWVATDNELRRHFAMVLAFLVAWLLARLWVELNSSRITKTLLTAIVLSLQGYFLYAYLGKPSHIDPNLKWSDYLAMNQVIEKQFPKIPVIGVSDPLGTGIEKPLAMEVTTAFSMPPHAVIHSRVSPSQFDILRKMLLSGDVAPYARQLGYRAVVWGPAEKKVWGERVARRFLCPENKLAETGEVSLYFLCDRLRARLDKLPNQNSGEFYQQVAQAFASEGWPQEALGYYFQAVKLSPQNQMARAGLVGLLKQYGREEEAEYFSSRDLTPAP